jgi:hypothetical protein
MTRSSKQPPPADPRPPGEVVLHTILAACKDDPEKLRKVLASIGDQAGDDVAHLEQGINKRLNELEANLPGFERDGAQDVRR